MQKATFRIQELDCTEECRVLRKAFHGQKGVEQLDFDILHHQMHVTYDPSIIDSPTLLQMIHSTGMQASLWEDRGKETTLSFWQRHGRLLLCLFSGALLFLGLIIQMRSSSEYVHDAAIFQPHYKVIPFSAILLYLASIVSSAWYVAPKAWANAKRFNLDMNVLMLVAVVGALAIGQWFEAGSVTFLFSVALLLQSWSIEKARKTISKLLALTPTMARVMVGDKLIEKNIEDVLVGDRVLVHPGEKIPLDGEIVKGSSSVNQAPITGESIPVSKEKGDLVFAGTINTDGTLEFRVTKGANDTTLARIIQMVQKARTRRAKSEQWVDRFSRYYTPIMLVLAISVAFVFPLVFGGGWLNWIYGGLVLLVIACPCSLVISTPVSIVSGLTRAAREGVLIKGGLFLEIIGKLDAIAFDKTGTITTGHPKVQRIVSLCSLTEKELLEVAARLEMPSEHPLSRAILEKASKEGLSPLPAENFQIFKGLGAEGTVEGKRYWIGSHRFMHEKKREEGEEAHQLALEMEDAGHSVIAIGDFSRVCGLISVMDKPRPYMQEILASIQALGVATVVMLTGDNKKTAETLAKEVGISTCLAELLPEDKVKAIEDLKKGGNVVAMVGDGINDAPAMAASSLGIAMGAMGSDVAFETADIVLMTDDLSHIPYLIRLSHNTLRIIKQNIAFSLGIKALFILLAFFGMTTLWMAIGADTGASLLVIFNGLRLLKK